MIYFRVRDENDRERESEKEGERERDLDKTTGGWNIFGGYTRRA